MKIKKIEMTRLYALSGVLNENGLYDLIPFDENGAAFNEEFEEGSLHDKLNALLAHLYGGGFYLDVDETDLADCGIETRGDFLRVQVGDETIEVPDVTDKINADSDESTTYLLVDRSLENANFVVAERVTH